MHRQITTTPLLKHLVSILNIEQSVVALTDILRLSVRERTVLLCVSASALDK